MEVMIRIILIAIVINLIQHGKLSAEEVDYWLSIGPHSCQHRDASLQPSKRVFNDQERYFPYSPLLCQMGKRCQVSGCSTHHQLGTFSASVVN